MTYYIQYLTILATSLELLMQPVCPSRGSSCSRTECGSIPAWGEEEGTSKSKCRQLVSHSYWPLLEHQQQTSGTTHCFHALQNTCTCTLSKVVVSTTCTYIWHLREPSKLSGWRLHASIRAYTYMLRTRRVHSCYGKLRLARLTDARRGAVQTPHNLHVLVTQPLSCSLHSQARTKRWVRRNTLFMGEFMSVMVHPHDLV